MPTSHPLITSRRWRRCQRFLLLAAFWCAAIAVSVHAQETIIKTSFANPPKEPIPVYVLTGQSMVVKFDQDFGRVAASNLDFAEAVLVAPDQIVINGKASGRARITVWSRNSEVLIFIDVDVRVNLAQIDSQVRALFPKDDIRLSQANGSVVISGSAEPKVVQQVEQVVQAAGFKTVNLLAQPVQNTAQVQLQVRVAEVSRNKLSEYSFSPAYQSSPGTGGFSNTGTGPYSVTAIDQGNIIGTVANNLNLFIMGQNVFAFLRALQSQGALRALAEPNLIAMSGQTASFLAGGEIPVPLVTGAGGNSAVSIQWKEYGVRLNFKPTIIDEQHIKLELEPEVSTLDYANAARLSGFLIPALRVRRAKTGIELQDGQSFGIAGLLDNNETKSLGKLPVIGDVPILGNLFKSKSFQRNETELIFIVTAKLSKPLNPDAVPRLKEVDGLRDGSPLGIEQPKSDKSDKTDGAASETAAPPAETATPTPATPTPATPTNEETKPKLPVAPEPAKVADLTLPLPLFKFEKLHWVLTPPPDIKLGAARALSAELNFVLPTAPVVKQEP
ncbi:MAG: type II and III secretion system protein family protein [Acidobacteria bacterium]|nr:type II and III secretion system protein family protein [Acidobacteriota bacterium]MBI3426333.1 type II and III secretion system protein family protein [Acidobacteriota bacterium]